MKKFLLLTLIPFLPLLCIAQQGLEDVIVEKYYVADANDTLANGIGGNLPVGSVTYRIFLDLLPGYKFQVAYGVPTHELRIETSTLFFNNEDRGSTTPNYSFNNAARNTVMLDSWLTVGAACSGRMGVLKSEDDGVGNIINNFSPQLLQNNDTSAGIPLTIQDGFIAGTPEAFTELGITNEIAVFDNQNDGTNGPVFSTLNGSWTALNGAMGADPLINKVLIAQITTDGTFSFKLNIQLRTPVPGVVENYVWDNPTGNEILFPALAYTSPSTGVEETIEHSSGRVPSFSLYPNPNTGIFSLLLFASREPGDHNISVYSIDGREVLSRALGELYHDVTEKIDISSLPSGTYIVEVSSPAGRYSRRIAKD